MDQFLLQSSEERFGYSIVPANPGPSIEPLIPYRNRHDANSTDVYCDPRSEWNTAPGKTRPLL